MRIVLNLLEIFTMLLWFILAMSSKTLSIFQKMCSVWSTQLLASRVLSRRLKSQRKTWPLWIHLQKRQKPALKLLMKSSTWMKIIQNPKQNKFPSKTLKKYRHNRKILRQLMEIPNHRIWSCEKANTVYLLFTLSFLLQIAVIKNDYSIIYLN